MKSFIPFLFILLFSCKPTENSSDHNKPLLFIELNAGKNGDFTQKVNRVISNQNDFNEVWDKAFSNFTDKEKTPEIDFKNKLILLVTMGQKNSGGYTIKIDQLTETQDNITVTILETSPGKSCVTSEVLTFPYQIVEIDKTTKKLVFETKEKVYDCN